MSNVTELDIYIAESKVNIWLSAATVVAIALALIPGFPAVTAVLIPSCVVSIRQAVISRRRRRKHSP